MLRAGRPVKAAAAGRKGRQSTGKDTLYVGDQHAVVGHGNTLFGGAFLAVTHLAGIEHAAAAVHDQAVR